MRTFEQRLHRWIVARSGLPGAAVIQARRSDPRPGGTFAEYLVESEAVDGSPWTSRYERGGVTYERTVTNWTRDVVIVFTGEHARLRAGKMRFGRPGDGLTVIGLPGSPVNVTGSRRDSRLAAWMVRFTFADTDVLDLPIDVAGAFEVGVHVDGERELVASIPGDP